MGKEMSELRSVEYCDKLHSHDVAGDTLYTLISTGTELGRYRNAAWYPVSPGYAAVMRVTSVGNMVTDIEPGDLVFCEGRHQSRMILMENEVLKLSSDITPKKALFARILKIALDVVEHCPICGTVQVEGRGLVAYFLRQVLENHGNTIVKDGGDTLFETSGKEENLLKAKEGCTVYLVGTPWVNRGVDACGILRHIFHKRITVKSGWEHKGFNYFEAMQMLCNGTVKVGNIYDTALPGVCHEVYQKLLYKRKKLTVIFDWTK